MSHEPIIIAGRVHRTYYTENGADRLLGLLAGPAVYWTVLVTVPVDRGPALATPRESYIVAGVGFILSTAFWAAFATAVSFLVRFGWRYHKTR